MMLNLRCDHLFLQASQNYLALAYRQSHGGRRELLYTLNRGNFELGGLPGTTSETSFNVHFIPTAYATPQLCMLSSTNAFSLRERDGCRSLRRALASIWRMRSRVTWKL